MSSRTPRLAAAFAVAAGLAIGTLVQVRLPRLDPRRHAAAAGGGAGTSLGETGAGTPSSGGAAGTPGPGRASGETAVRPLLEQAFAAARRRDYALARTHFAQLRRESAGRAWTALGENSTTETRRHGEEQGKGGAAGTGEGEGAGLEERRRAPDGRLLPTLEEEAAYQEAVLTEMPDGGFRSPEAAKAAAPAAERALLTFMRQYPENPLVASARWRIMRLHRGELPEEAERVWRAARATARRRREARERARSLCGPLLAAEVLRRWGAPADQTEVLALARELATDHQGTTLLSLARLFRRRGLQAEGQRLTYTGLRKAWLVRNITTETRRRGERERKVRWRRAQVGPGSPERSGGSAAEVGKPRCGYRFRCRHFSFPWSSPCLRVSVVKPKPARGSAVDRGGAAGALCGGRVPAGRCVPCVCGGVGSGEPGAPWAG